MTVFGEYADLYDTLYSDKNYEQECDFLSDVFKRFALIPVQSILDLGCGTGGHILPLARRGYEVMGIDKSETMLRVAQSKVHDSGAFVPLKQGDIRHLDLGVQFDAVISMFAVMSYMTSNEDLSAAFQTAARHLRPGGLFFFDAWSGFAVLSELPADRFKCIESGGTRIFRFVHPTLKILQHTVEVGYKVLELHENRVVKEIDEIHPMRFFFPLEIAQQLQLANMRLQLICPFLRLDETLSTTNWELAVVAVKE